MPRHYKAKAEMEPKMHAKMVAGAASESPRKAFMKGKKKA